MFDGTRCLDASNDGYLGSYPISFISVELTLYILAIININCRMQTVSIAAVCRNSFLCNMHCITFFLQLSSCFSPIFSLQCTIELS